MAHPDLPVQPLPPGKMAGMVAPGNQQGYYYQQQQQYAASSVVTGDQGVTTTSQAVTMNASHYESVPGTSGGVASHQQASSSQTVTSQGGAPAVAAGPVDGATVVESNGTAISQQSAVDSQPTYETVGSAMSSGTAQDSRSNASSTGSETMATGQIPVDEADNLDAMLGNLNTDMNRHGIVTIPKGHCAACAKPIVGQVITALGKIWHPEHFICEQCGEQLGTQNFFEREGLPYCEKDYHTLFSPKCGHCNGPILDKCVTALDKSWHPEHFVCSKCGQPFGEEGFHEKDGKAFCRDDYFQLFAPKCGNCRNPIMDNYISALNRQWHPECFICMECQIPFGGGSFFDHEGMPYCETHYHAMRGSLCAGCHKPITGRCITAMYKKFHPEHFVCAFCLKQLNKGTFKEQNDKPYCNGCFVKLFG